MQKTLLNKLTESIESVQLHSINEDDSLLMELIRIAKLIQDNQSWLGFRGTHINNIFMQKLHVLLNVVELLLNSWSSGLTDKEIYAWRDLAEYVIRQFPKQELKP